VTVTTDPTDAELVQSARDEADAFARLYERYAPSLLAFLRGVHGGDEHAADDSLQETFLRAYLALDRFDRARPLAPWLFTIASRVGWNARARARRMRAVDVEHLLTLAGTTGESGPDQLALADACETLLARAKEQIGSRKLESFVLARTAGVAYDEIARRHKCSSATVKRDLQDAVATLRLVATELGLGRDRATEKERLMHDTTDHYAAPANGELTEGQVLAVLRHHELTARIASGFATPVTENGNSAAACLAQMQTAVSAACDELGHSPAPRLPFFELAWATDRVKEALRLLLLASPESAERLKAQARARVSAAEEKLRTVEEERMALDVSRSGAGPAANAAEADRRAKELSRRIEHAATLLEAGRIRMNSKEGEEERAKNPRDFAMLREESEKAGATLARLRLELSALEARARDPSLAGGSSRDAVAAALDRRERESSGELASVKNMVQELSTPVEDACKLLEALPATNVRLVRAHLSSLETALSWTLTVAR
jgi:RNA polymerase sigma-70 factor (ECF subfamily)